MDKYLQNSKLFCLRTLLVLLLSFSGRHIECQSVDEQYLAGCAYTTKGEFSKAADCFSMAIVRNNSDAQLYMLRGMTWLQTDNIEQAVEDFNEANLILPQVADIWLARAYALSDAPEKAIEALKSHLDSPFRLPEDSIKRDPAFDLLQQTAAWDILWQHEWYTDSEKAMAEALHYSHMGLFDKALSVLDDEISASARGAKLYAMRGMISYEQGNYGAAIADFSAALQVDKNYAGVHAQRGMAYLKSENFKAAEADFSKALKADPGNFRLYVERAGSWAGLQQWQLAVKDMLLYLKYFDSDFNALYQCGEYYFEGKDYINALKCFNRNLKDDPNNGLYYKARGKTYLKTSTYRYALSDLSMSLDLRPDDAETWMYLGLCKIQSGDKVNGCSDLEKSRKMGNTEALRYIIDNCN